MIHNHSWASDPLRSRGLPRSFGNGSYTRYTRVEEYPDGVRSHRSHDGGSRVRVGSSKGAFRDRVPEKGPWTGVCGRGVGSRRVYTRSRVVTI